MYPEYEVFSAGIEPHAVNQYAVKVMQEKNISLSHVTQKIESFSQKELDYVITVCDKASQKCPVKFEGVQILHRNFSGPSQLAKTKESEDEKLECYRTTRDEIHCFIQDLPKFLASSSKS